MFVKNRFLAWPSRVIFVLALAPLLVGCSSKGTLSGKVFYKGNPLPGGTVTFEQQFGAFNSAIKDDGSYQVTGLEPGPATITVSSPDPPASPPPGKSSMEASVEKAKSRKVEIPPEVAKHLGDPDAARRRYMSIPSKYKDPKQSGLTYTVKGGSQSYDIQLE
jgi:hypothetical protein